MVVPEPGAIKTFGVLHLVVAGIGLVMNLFSLVSTIFFQSFTKRFAAPRGAAGPTVANQEDAMMLYMSEMQTYTYLTIAFNCILIVMLTIAGIGLLKGREKGRVMSIRYAWTSLATKLIAVIYTFALVIPATQRFTETMYQGLPGGMGNTMSSIMQYSQVFTILVYCAYPVVVLVVMKGEKIKEYLAGR